MILSSSFSEIRIDLGETYLLPDPSLQTLTLRAALTPPQWIPEISHHAPGVPLILVGTKLDLREDPVTLQRLKERRFAPISYAMGAQCGRDVGAVKYLEASSKT